MSKCHLIRSGALGHVGRFSAVDAVCYPRHSRVILRTQRGIEIGDVLLPPDGHGDRSSSDGEILRGMTVEDQLLEARLNSHRDAAFDACRKTLAERELPVTLVDVEHLFDGQNLYFYFLGEVTPEVSAMTEELARQYETKVQFRKFADALIEGCGPGCGTDEGGPGGCDSCSASCAIADACGSNAAHPA